MRARCVIAALGVAACSSSSSPSPAADAGAQTATSSLTVWVYDLPVAADAPQPIAGATVAFDAPGADRAVATSDANGRAVVAFDPSKGPGTVTAFAKDHVVTTVFGVDQHASERIPGNQLDKPATDFVAYLPLSASGIDARTVKLSGAIENAAATTDNVNIGPSVIGTIFDAPRNGYAMRVPKGRAYFLLGSEYALTRPDPRSVQATIAKFFKIDRMPESGDATFDLDLAAAPSVDHPTRHVRLVIPGGDAGPLGATSFGAVNVSTSDAFLVPGVIASAAPSADKNGFECDVAIAQVDVSGAPLVTTGTIRATDGAASQRAEAGVVDDGTTLDGFLLPPTFGAASASLAQPIDLSGLPSGATAVRIFVTDGLDVVWTAHARRDAIGATLTMPAPPPGFPLPSSMQGVLAAIGDPLRLSNGMPYPKAMSTSKPFTVTP